MQLLHVVLLACLIALSTTNALQFDVYGQRKTATSGVVRRADIKGSQLNNSADISYYVDLTLGGKTFQLLVDTGRCVRRVFLSLLAI